MKNILLAVALLTSIFSHAQSDSTYSFSTGIIYTSYNTIKVNDTTSTIDTTNVGLPSYLPIEAINWGWDADAAFVNIEPQDGDGISYIVIRYHLFDAQGHHLYSNRYRIDGTCFAYYQANGLQYAYWKILNDPKTHLSKY